MLQHKLAVARRHPRLVLHILATDNVFAFIHEGEAQGNDDDAIVVAGNPPQ